MELSSVLTIVSILDKSKGLYDWFTGLSRGDQLKKSVIALEATNAPITRLSDKILWAPSFIEASGHSSMTENLTAAEADLVRRLSNSAEPYQGDTLISAISASPPRLRKAFSNDPFQVLIDPRPERRATRPTDPDLVPIRFYDDGQYYIGWQKRGVLPSLFDCDFEQRGQLILPVSVPAAPTKASIKKFVNAVDDEGSGTFTVFAPASPILDLIKNFFSQTPAHSMVPVELKLSRYHLSLSDHPSSKPGDRWEFSAISLADGCWPIWSKEGELEGFGAKVVDKVASSWLDSEEARAQAFYFDGPDSDGEKTRTAFLKWVIANSPSWLRK
jgi:hypothetical protein